MTVLILPPALGLLLFGVLQTPQAKDFITRTVNNLDLGDLNIEIENLEGILPFQIRLDRLRCYDSHGLFVDIRQLQLDILPWSLKRGGPGIDLFRVQRLHLDRLPRLPTGPDKVRPAPDSDSKQMSSLPFFVFVRSLDIPTLSLGQEILGRGAAFAVSGQGTIKSTTQWALDCDLQQTNTQGLKIHLVAGMQASPSGLDLDVSFQDQPGGIILEKAGLALSDPLRLRLQGNGPITDWEGHMAIDLGDKTLSTTELKLDTDANQVHVSASSELFPAPLLPRKLSGLQASLDQVNMHAAATLDQDGSRLHLQNFGLRSKLAHIDLQGRADMHNKKIEATGSVQVPDLELLQPLLNMPVAGTVHLNLAASGPLNQPEMSLQTRIRDLTIQDYYIHSVDLDVQPQVHRSQAGALEQVVLNGELSTDTILEHQSPLLPGPLQTTFRTILHTDPKSLEVQSLRLTLPGMETVVQGQAQTSGPFQAQIDTHIKDVHRFPQLQGLSLHSGLQIQSTLAGDWQQSTGTGSLDMSLTDLKGLPDPAAGLLGSTVTIESALHIQEGKRASLQSLHIAGQEIDIRAQGDMGLSTSELKAEWNIQGPKLSALELGDLAGVFFARGHLRGTLSDLETSIDMEVANLAGFGLRPSHLDCRLNTRIHPFKPEVVGDISLDLARSDEHITLTSPVEFAHQVLSLPDLRLQGPESKLTAQVDLDSHKKYLRSELELSILKAQALQSFFHFPVQGGTSVSASIDGPLNLPRISASGQVNDLQAAKTQIKHLSFQTTLKDIQTLAGSLNLHAEHIVSGSNQVNSLTISAQGEKGEAEAELELAGHVGADLELSSTASFSKDQDTLQLALPRGTGRYGDLPFSWNQALQAELGADSMDLSWPALRLGQGTLQIQARTEQDNVQGNIQAQGLQLNQLPLPAGFGLTGGANAQVNLSGTQKAPKINFQLRAANVQSKLGQAEDRPPVHLQVSGSLERRTLQGNLSAQGDQGLALTADINLPVDFSLQPWNLQPGRELIAELQGHADLGLVSTFFPLDGQELDGDISMEIDISGPLSQPPVQGNIQLSQGRFENYSSGTVLEDIQARIVLHNNRATLKDLQATDGEKGKIQISGDIDFAPNQDLSYTADTELTQATLVRMDTATAAVSGNVHLQGTASGADIHGQLKAFPVNIGLPEPAPSGLQGLTIVRDEKAKSHTDTQPPPSPPSFAQNTSLDVVVNIPGGCFVRGRGLDSEWEGNLHIQGQAAKPRISGYVQVVRGHLNLLTKRFNLDKGRITLLSQYPPQPEIDLVASTHVSDLLAKVNVSGQATEPSIELSSEPTLPRDEILARILFNRDLSQISPVQAVKLALAVRTLTSGGSGGFMASVRENMGLDDLSVQSGSSGVTVGAGKYLNENIYFKVEKGMQEDSGQVRVNIQMTPSISLESKAGSENQGLYITWSYTY